MNAPVFRIERLAGQERGEFTSGSAALDTYLWRQAEQDQRRRVAACFVAVEQASSAVVGFYTLSACHIWLNGLDVEQQRKLPRYPTVPSVLLGRLAVDQQFQGRGLGAALLANAVARAIRSEVAAAIMVVDASNSGAARFYRHHGFRPDPKQPLRLYASLAQLRDTFDVS